MQVFEANKEVVSEEEEEVKGVEKPQELAGIRQKFEEEMQMKKARNYLKELQKVQILNESETYYQVNMNTFNNNMSLLALNTYEISQLLGILNNENSQILGMAKNIHAHTSFMEQKSLNLHRKLKDI
eukprot:CAMPEP_0202978898 /NCGR_PEP_ID=MMETSP1396-20130829/85192_1 /ASSEMBLY_ACC=CAM_ASM_000872 /TAXON_ID= /ORGANISM="Pseudokeronopsis sp., Strain Brazil" /LENGTH=126 /DNA_ID=CAMNT_0049718071 /DNA_START=1893 /DNA_END=2273 /DNA_ORIENTATION=-